MNFIQASVAAQGKIRIAESMLPLPHLDNLTPNLGDVFDIAVRPEQIQFVDRFSESLPVRIVSSEFLGRFIVLSVNCNMTQRRKRSSLMYPLKSLID